MADLEVTFSSANSSRRIFIVILFQLANALKDLNLKIQTSSLKERKQVIDNVINVLSNPGN